MSQHVLISGATGYLGSRLTNRLLSKGHKVTALIRKDSSLSRLDAFKEKLEFIFQDDISSIQSVDIFIHTATSYGRNGESEGQVRESNVNFPKYILESITHEDLVVVNTDTSLPSNLSTYSQTKREFRDFLKENADKLIVLNVVLEQFYGPHDSSFLGFVKNCLDNNKAIELTDGNQKRDFIFVDDVLNAYMLLVSKISSFKAGFHSFPLGSGKSHSIREVVGHLAKALGADESLLKWGARPKREGEPDELVADITKIKSLGFEPKISIIDGITKLASN